MQAAGIGGIGFVVGASMEFFMVKTGFYAIATKKEAERRALVLREQEERTRLRHERRRQKLENQHELPQLVKHKYQRFVQTFELTCL
jgi:hypothetical protein